jgi:hypothetical protein
VWGKRPSPHPIHPHVIYLPARYPLTAQEIIARVGCKIAKIGVADRGEQANVGKVKHGAVKTRDPCPVSLAIQE